MFTHTFLPVRTVKAKMQTSKQLNCISTVMGRKKLVDGCWSCVSLPAEGRVQEGSTGLGGKRLITQAVSKVKDKCGKQTLVENQKHEI